MLLGAKDVRLSLAGAQEKISLAYFDRNWHIPKNGAPSTHILKPSISGEFASMARNEFFCMHLEEKMEIKVPQTSILQLDGISVLVCQRYDRMYDEKNGVIQRLHQEDFCQALGIMSDSEYQADGCPSFKDCSDLIKKSCSDKIEQMNCFF